MTNTDKLAEIKTLMGIEGTQDDNMLNAYLNLTAREILNWLYGDIPEGATVPTRYDSVHIMSVVIGFGMNGAEGETAHTELDTTRQWKYPSAIEYIHANVIPYIKVG